MSLPESQVPVMKRADALEGFLYLRDGVYDVRNYGAVGDGETDDTAAIQAAVDAAGVGGIVKFGGGLTYLTTGLITIPEDGMTLRGYGATITSATSSQWEKFQASGRTGVKILGLSFDCLYSTVSGQTEPVIDLIGCVDALVRDCYIANAPTGIRVSGASFQVSIINNTFYKNFLAIFSDDNGVAMPIRVSTIGNQIRTGLGTTSTSFSGAIKMSGTGSAASSAGNVISGNCIADCGQMGIEIQTWVNDTVISGNSVSGGGYGVSVSFCSRVSVTGNTVLNVDGTSLEAADSTFVSFTGNVARTSNAISHVTTPGSSDVTITGGSIYAGSVGMQLFGTRITVSGVQLSRQTGQCFNIKGSNVTITGCLLELSGAERFIGIDSDAGDRSEIAIIANRFEGNVTDAGISLYAPSNTISDVLVANNHTSGMTCTGGAWSTSGSSSQATRILRVRSKDNVGPGSNSTLSNFNLPSYAIAGNLAYYYDYYYLEQSVVSVDATGGARSVELPPATNTGGYTITVQKSDASGNAVTVSANAGTINGAATVPLASQFKRATFVSDGTNWIVIQSN